MYVPYPLQLWEKLIVENEALQLALGDWVGKTSVHPPPDPRLQLFRIMPIRLISLKSEVPLQEALTVFTDGGKVYGACTWQTVNGWQTKITPPQTSAQRAELAAVILAFQEHEEQAINLICDSQYVYGLVTNLYGAYLSSHVEKSLLSLFITLQLLLEKRAFPYFIAHIRSHQPFPGGLTEGNELADQQTKGVFTITPWDSHFYFHQNAKALRKQFQLTHAEASAIVQQCPACSQQAIESPCGVNPRGLQRNEIWQMDVTHHPPFAPWKYLHVSIDTFSGFIMASAQRGEATKHVINHCMKTFTILGAPMVLKTDNGAAYCSSAFAEFCTKWSIQHKFGIPYNSTGQAICERANGSLKKMLDHMKKQERMEGPGLPGIQNVLNLALYTLNFLNLSTGSPLTAAERLCSSSTTGKVRPNVWIKLLPDPGWKGPYPLVTWGRGYAAVEYERTTRWIPARCVRPYLADFSRTEPEDSEDQ